MSQSNIEKLYAKVRDVTDFPKPGIVFKDITPILGSGEHFRLALDELQLHCLGLRIDKVVGVDARGFIFGAALADRLRAGFVPIRKKGKLPYTTEKVAYSLEYGEAEIEVHVDAIQPGDNVVLVDDLLATGGTAKAAAQLIVKKHCHLLKALFLIELTFLGGRQNLPDMEIVSLLRY